MRNISILFILFFLFIKASYAVCETEALNPISDVAWENMFPMKIGNIVQLGNTEGNNSLANDADSSTTCNCNVGGVPKVGLSVEFWEPARIVDTVSDSNCMMPLGTDIGEPSASGELDGSYSTREGRGKIFQQAHEYIFPAFALLDLYTDLPCMNYDESDIFDISMMTEVLPTWNSDVLSLIINPEAVLFANPAAQLACAADATSAMLNAPINALYWCAGGWGSVYPLAGSGTASDYVEGNALIAAKAIYLMGRLGVLEEFNPNGCTTRYVKFWNKDRYKIQLMKPVKDNGAIHIGKPGILWTSQKHPVVSKDNFSWLVFRKVNCCVSY